MDINFNRRGEGWRTRGRPATWIPPEVLDALQTTYDDGTQAEFDVAGATDAEVRAFVSVLGKGATKLGKRLKHQITGTILRFYVEDK